MPKIDHEQNMRHNFNSSVSYDTERFPINKGARKMLSKQAPLDLTDERAADALALAEILQGSGALARGISTTECASLILQRLPKRTKAIETTIAPDLMNLRKQELDFRRECLRNEKENSKRKAAMHTETIAATLDYTQVFKDVAKEWLTEKDYSVLIDMTIEERARRIAAAANP